MQTSFPSAAAAGGPAQVPLDTSKEMRVATTRAEREQLDEMSELYGVLKATDMLEASYAKGHIDADAYTSACSSLISSFQMQERALQSKGILTGPDSVPKFMREFGLDATRAQLRLLEDRVPATAKYTTATHEYKPSHVHETTSLYITVRDALVMGMTAKDRLYPHLTALMTSLQRHAMLPADHPSKATLSPWLSRLNAMDASDELSESQARTMALDVQQSNSAFEEALEGTS